MQVICFGSDGRAQVIRILIIVAEYYTNKTFIVLPFARKCLQDRTTLVCWYQALFDKCQGAGNPDYA